MATLLGSPIFVLLILILLKTFVDVQAHLREHKRYADKKELNVEHG